MGKEIEETIEVMNIEATTELEVKLEMKKRARRKN